MRLLSQLTTALGPQAMLSFWHITAATVPACFVLPACLFFISVPSVMAQEATVVETAFAGSTPLAIAFMASILVLKITAFVLGYLIVRLGHDTLVKGISGEIDFGFSGSGFTTKLKSGSPGALFVVMGAAIILWGLMVQKPMEIKVAPVPAQLTTQAGQPQFPLHRADVPD